MERSHYRYRIIERMRELPHLLQESLQQRNERSLESYTFLQQAGEDIPGELERLGRKLKRSLLCCAAVCLVLFLLMCLLSGRQKDIDTLVLRDAYDGEDREEEVRLAVSWADTVYEEDVLLQIPRKEISRQEAYTLFEACRSRIHAELFSEHVTKDLKLPLTDESGFVSMAWSSSDPARISDEGRVNLTGAKDGERVELAAVMQAGDYEQKVSFQAVLMPSAAKNLKTSLQYEAMRLLQDLPAALTSERQELPKTTSGGAQAVWHAAEKGLPWEIAGVFLLASAFLLFSRIDPLKKRLKNQKAAFEREIPNMSLQMILLLDAGLTVDGAFQRLILENRGKDHPLYRAFAQLEQESRSTNLPFVNALYVYARQSGVRELIRFSALALDCSGRGAELSEKLDRERQQLWNSRLNRAKAKAREAETKLCLPLMLLLMVLVMIAIAPALMEM